ncbi:MAG: O-antigen ligase domain-containing protein [Planctomycetota bacterium]
MTTLSLTGNLALTAVAPATCALFVALGPRRGALASVVLGYLFLPQGVVRVPGACPDLDRAAVVHLSVLLGVVLFDPRRLRLTRPRVWDVPILVWCLVPFATSIANGLGPYDGLSAVFVRGLHWAIPYWVGRAYFAGPAVQRQLALGVFVGGLLYVLPCIYEMRMSPQLHRMVYGAHQHRFLQTLREGGGYRPMVFLQHGLAVGMWLTVSTLLGGWLWRARGGRGGLLLPLGVGAILLTALACRSWLALLLLVVGGGAMLACQRLRRTWPLLLLTLLPGLYVDARLSGQLTGQELVRWLRAEGAETRADSLEFRFKNEGILAEKALQRPVLGWGGWKRARVFDEQGRDISTTDGWWIIALGENGWVGLCALMAVHLVPVWWVCRLRPRPLTSELAPALGLATILALTMIDDLLNAMYTPFAPLFAGALLGLSARPRRARKSGASAPRA